MSAPFFKLKAETPKGTYDFAQLEGKVTLIVNTASNCGFTSQYTGLEQLNKRYAEKGLIVLGFPCNQFGGQEPGSDEAVASFCTKNHGVTFPLMKKSDVNGDNTNEVFAFLKSEKKNLMMERIKWNFEKFLVDREGNVVSRYASTSTPAAIGADIEKLL